MTPLSLTGPEDACPWSTVPQGSHPDREECHRTDVRVSTAYHQTTLNVISSLPDRAHRAAPSDCPDSSRAAGNATAAHERYPHDSPRAERGASHRLRQRHDGNPLR